MSWPTGPWHPRPRHGGTESRGSYRPRRRSAPRPGARSRRPRPTLEHSCSPQDDAWKQQALGVRPPTHPRRPGSRRTERSPPQGPACQKQDPRPSRSPRVTALAIAPRGTDVQALSPAASHGNQFEGDTLTVRDTLALAAPRRPGSRTTSQPHPLRRRTRPGQTRCRLSRDQIKTAWGCLHALRPDPPKAYAHAVRAVESAAHAIIEPGNANATMGTMLGQNARQPRPLQTRYPRPNGTGDIAPVTAMMKLLWQGQTRHGSQTAALGRYRRRLTPRSHYATQNPA